MSAIKGKPMKMVTKACQDCGEEFISSSNRAKRCKDCQHKVNNLCKLNYHRKMAKA